MNKTQAFTTAALAAVTSALGIGAAQAQTAPTPAPTVTTRWNGSPETREEDRRFHVNGRFQYDVAYTDADYANQTGGLFVPGVRSYARRAFIGVDGRLTEQWRYNVKLDINMSGSPSVRADDLYLEYAGADYSFIVGNNNAISPMEDRDSSLNIPFNERSFLITAAGVGKRPGIAVITNGGNWSLGAALSSNDTLDTADTAANGSESWFAAARGTWAPIFQQTPEGTTVLHLGAYYRHRENGDGNGNTLNTGLLSYSPGALSNKANNNAGVGAANADDYWNIEAALQWNAFGLDAEYGQIDSNDSALNATQTGDASATGYYVDAFWSITGESRKYNAADGSFGAVTPFRTLGSDGGIGHLMLSARYEDFDATDLAFAGNRNETSAWTAGLTWVPISHVKFQLNYSNTQIDYVIADLSHRDNEIRAATLRTQFDW